MISGSAALQFFNRCTYSGSGLDIYAHMRHRLEVGSWLICEGYAFVPNSKQEPVFYDAARSKIVVENKADYFMRGVAGVFNFVKKGKECPGDEAERKVQLIIAARTPMEIILYYHSSEYPAIVPLS